MINDILFHSNANFCVNYLLCSDFSFLFSFWFTTISLLVTVQWLLWKFSNRGQRWYLRMGVPTGMQENPGGRLRAKPLQKLKINT